MDLHKGKFHSNRAPGSSTALRTVFGMSKGSFWAGLKLLLMTWSHNLLYSEVKMIFEKTRTMANCNHCILLKTYSLHAICLFKWPSSKCISTFGSTNISCFELLPILTSTYNTIYPRQTLTCNYKKVYEAIIKTHTFFCQLCRRLLISFLSISRHNFCTPSIKITPRAADSPWPPSWQGLF